jgi:hypothetical protein
MKRISLLLLPFVCSLPAFAGEILIPAVFRGPGAFGSDWRTEIVVSDLSPSNTFPFHTTISFHPTGISTPMTVDLLISQRETYAIHDALMEWFGVIQGNGIVRVTWDDPNGRITARGRIYNVSTGGEFGQEVPGLPLESLQFHNYLPGVSGVDGNRTNIGVSNPHDTDVGFWVELFDTSGLSRGSFRTTVEAHSYKPFNDIFSHFQAGPLNAAMVHVLAIEKPLYPYASVVRADTGDATFITPAR